MKPDFLVNCGQFVFTCKVDEIKDVVSLCAPLGAPVVFGKYPDSFQDVKQDLMDAFKNSIQKLKK